MINGKFFTLTETALILGKHRSTINEWMKNGKIEGRRVGNMVLFEEGEVERLKQN